MGKESLSSGQASNGQLLNELMNEKFIHQMFIEHSRVPGAAQALGTLLLMLQWGRLEALDPGRKEGGEGAGEE